MRMFVLLEKRPLKNLKLYELTDDEIGIDLEQVTKWSTDNIVLYEQIAENGFADFICNKENIREFYNSLDFSSMNIQYMSPELVHLTNLKTLKINHNSISVLENIPINLIELHLFNNPLTTINLIKHNLQYLGLGYCQLSDDGIQSLHKYLPSLLSLDLTHNNLCNLEYSVEALKKISSLKVLSLYGNPIVMMPQYFNYITENLVELKYFDEQKFSDIKQRILQVELDKQTKIQEAIKKQQEEQEQARLLAEKNSKKGGKQAAPPPQIQQPIQEIVQDNEDWKTAKQFKIAIKIQTLENLDGILLDKIQYPLMESKASLFQSKYWVEYEFNGQTIKSNQVLYDTATIENNAGRIDFDFLTENMYTPDLDIRKYVEDGFIIRIWCEEPVLKLDDDGEYTPKLTNEEVPEQKTRALGVVRIQFDWLRGNNKLYQMKLKLFPEEASISACLWLPNLDENALIQLRMEYIQSLIQKELDDKKAAQQAIDQLKEQVKGKGKGKDIKKKDDKKKGKDEQIQKPIQILNYQIDPREYVYVNQTTIYRATRYLLAINACLSS